MEYTKYGYRQEGVTVNDQYIHGMDIDGGVTVNDQYIHRMDIDRKV